MADAAFRPHRSCLYLPGANSRAMDKARSLAADALIFDLEDAVAPEAKDAARKAVCDALAAGGYGPRLRVVRINGLETPWGQEDLAAAVAAAPDAILAPKVSQGGDIDRIDDALSRAGAPDTMALWIMVETPRALLNLRDIAQAAERTRLKALVMGTNDLAKEMRATPTPDRIAFQSALAQTVIAARAYGLLAIDGVFNDIPNLDGLESECRQGASMGFDGKTLIHPSHLERTNRIFSPNPADVAQAREIIAAFEDPANAGQGVLKVNGRMTEILHLEEARRLVQVTEAIARLEEAAV